MAPADTFALPPFRLSPVFHTRIWGFRDLAPWFNVKATGDPIGEVWLTGDECAAETGPLTGKSLKDCTAEYGKSLVGSGYAGDGFPLLIKVLFPREKLSVQVHPDDVLAQKLGQPRGKTECWYALEAEPGAQVAVGLKPGVDKDMVRKAIADKTLEDLLEYVPVAAGDMVFVDAGTVHAILPGSVILETQQNSDITYRLYDYGRPRELHLEKSLEAMRSSTAAGKVAPVQEGDHTTLVDANYFRVDRFVIEGQATSRALSQNGGGVELLFVAEGEGTVSGDGFEPFTLSRCQIAVVPASAGEWKLEAHGKLEVIRMIPKSATSA